MTVILEKPPLNDELLVHYGIPGMRWGHRKGPAAYIPHPRQRAAQPEPTTRGRSQPKLLPGARTSMKVGRKAGKFVREHKVGVSIAVGTAATAILLSSRGATPRTKAISSKSTKMGFKAVGKLLKVIGKTTIKTVPKIAKVTGKATGSVAKVSAKGAAKGVKAVSVNSFGTVVRSGSTVGRGIITRLGSTRIPFGGG